MAKPVDTREVRAMVDAGAQLVDVLPTETFRHEHLPNAISLPMAEIGRAKDVLDPARPVITYCYDAQCDLSARAAARLEQLGFEDMYDYVTSKVAWLAEGLPGAGLLTDAQRALGHVHEDVPTVPASATVGDVTARIGEWELAVVVDGNGVVLGVVRPEVSALDASARVIEVMQPAPPTVRPSIPVRELAASMDNAGEAHILVTRPDGHLLGLVRRDELERL